MNILRAAWRFLVWHYEGLTGIRANRLAAAFRADGKRFEEEMRAAFRRIDAGAKVERPEPVGR